VNLVLYYLLSSLIFEYVFEYSIAASYSLISYLNSSKYSAKSDNENEGYLSVGMRRESTGSYSNSNELYHI
jgi:hypothetical protein